MIRSQKWLLLLLFGGVFPSLLAEPPPLRLASQLDHRYYPLGTTEEIFVETTLTALEESTKSLPRPRNLCFLVDSSSSMSADDFQAVRKALNLALEQLQGHDMVSLVTFGSAVETLLPVQRVANLGPLDEVLLRLAGEGGSSLFDGLGQAAAQIRREASPETVDQIILLCDGPPTKGPREPEDFRALATQLQRESIALITMGLGHNFDEDLLSELARISGGEFHFVPEIGQLPSTLAAVCEPLAEIVAENVVVTVTFHRAAASVKGYGWREAEEELPVVRWRLPRIFAGQEIKLLSSVEMRSFYTGRPFLEEFAHIQLAYELPDSSDKSLQQDERTLEARFSDSREQVDISINESVYRSIVDEVISDAMQEAIEAIDEGKPSRAERILRRTRSRIVSWNFDLDDPDIEARLDILKRYLEEVKDRGLSPFDRKILRSGLFRLVDPPSPDDDEDEN
jgi:Ca-activated chloride channel family protein